MRGKFVFLVLAFLPFLLSARSVMPEQTQTDIAEIPFARGIHIDGERDEWTTAAVVSSLTAPWNGNMRDETTVYLCHDRKYLYFFYEVHDTTPVYNSQKSKMSVIPSDRAEFFISCDRKMKQYYCAEIDPQGKTLDYEASFYRKMNYEWEFSTLKVASQKTASCYVIEGCLSLKELRRLKLITPDKGLYMGVYRADFVNDKDVIWYSWIIPEAEKPDFHIPSSLGKFILK